MKPAPPERSIPKLRPLRSLYIQNGATGKKGGTPPRITDKKKFKPQANTFKYRRNTLSQAKNISRFTQTGINSMEPSRISKVINSGGGVEKCPQLNGIFLRPSIDVRSFHRQIMERAKRLGESLHSDENKSKLINETIKQSPPKVPCTPKRSGLTVAYLKLSESKKKMSALKKASSSPPISPFGERLKQRKNQMVSKKVADVNSQGILEMTNAHLKASLDIDIKENKLPDLSFTNTKYSPTSNMESEAGKITDDSNALYNILKQCQLYNKNMLNINNRMDVLDESFQKVMVGEMGGHIHATFRQYQSKKLELYKMMERLEEELEKSVESEVNVRSKFKDYLTKKRNILKERVHLQKNFERVLKKIMESYEKERCVPAKGETLEELMSTLVEKKVVNDMDKAETVLRRSKRLLETPKNSGKGVESAGAAARQSAEKENQVQNDLVMKKSRNSYEKKRIQSLIYKDLQKSFNLCSPECSF